METRAQIKKTSKKTTELINKSSLVVENKTKQRTLKIKEIDFILSDDLKSGITRILFKEWIGYDDTRAMVLRNNKHLIFQENIKDPEREYWDTKIDGNLYNKYDKWLKKNIFSNRSKQVKFTIIDPSPLGGESHYNSALWDKKSGMIYYFDPAKDTSGPPTYATANLLPILERREDTIFLDPQHRCQIDDGRLDVWCQTWSLYWLDKVLPSSISEGIPQHHASRHVQLVLYIKELMERPELKNNFDEFIIKEVLTGLSNFSTEVRDTNTGKYKDGPLLKQMKSWGLEKMVNSGMMPSKALVNIADEFLNKPTTNTGKPFWAKYK